MIRRREEALKLLSSARFFRHFLAKIEEAGLAGEKENALTAFIVCISRFLDTPLNLFIKGQSSSGKNFLARKVLDFIPERHVFEISNATDAAWNYQGMKLMHKIIYEQEIDKKRGSIHPSRLLVSEKRLKRVIVDWKNHKRTPKTLVTKGPVACISTSTANQLQFDDESRRISVWIDESEAQTQEIMVRYAQNQNDRSKEDMSIWHDVQHLLKERAKTSIEFPEWMKEVAQCVPADDVRARRYFPAFLQAVKTVCLIRSFQRRDEQIRNGKPVRVRFSDLAIAAIIFEKSFRDSLSRGEDQELLDCIQEISADKNGKSVGATEVARNLEITYDVANRRINKAVKAGSIQRTNKPTQGNAKLYAVTSSRRFLPDPEQVFHNVNDGPRRVKFAHPLTGRRITYVKRRK